jgi:hypothetical protein
LEEAARTLGAASSFSAFCRVTLPIIFPALGAAFALVFLDAMKELTATLLLSPTGLNTLATASVGAHLKHVEFAAAAPYAALLIRGVGAAGVFADDADVFEPLNSTPSGASPLPLGRGRFASLRPELPQARLQAARPTHPAPLPLAVVSIHRLRGTLGSGHGSPRPVRARLGRPVA